MIGKIGMIGAGALALGLGAAAKSNVPKYIDDVFSLRPLVGPTPIGTGPTRLGIASPIIQSKSMDLSSTNALIQSARRRGGFDMRTTARGVSDRIVYNRKSASAIMQNKLNMQMRAF